MRRTYLARECIYRHDPVQPKSYHYDIITKLIMSAGNPKLIPDLQSFAAFCGNTNNYNLKFHLKTADMFRNYKS